MKKTRKKEGYTFCGRGFRDMEAVMREIRRVAKLHMKLMRALGLTPPTPRKRK